MKLSGEGQYKQARRKSTKPLPCPFCRGRYEIVHQDRLADDTQGNDLSCIVCDTCGAWGPWVTGGYPKAVRFWNMRNARPEDLVDARRIKAPHLEDVPTEEVQDAKRCPFCTCKNHSIGNCGEEEEPCFYVRCKNCGTCGPQAEIDEPSTKEQAVREWNGELIALFRHKHGNGSDER